MAAVEECLVHMNHVFTPIPSVKTLKMKTAGYYIPKIKKDNPLGEDAYFINETKQTFGLADGVGGWAMDGIDAGQYARDFMYNASVALQRQLSGFVDPKQVIMHAYLTTEAKGSSTACIITLKDKFLHAVNIGDSGFIVIRGKDLVFETKPQQHCFNCPYQLGMSSRRDTPDMADEFFVQVESGDVVVAGTDGLFDNVYNEEIKDMVEACLGRGRTPVDTAMLIANRAKSEFCRSGVSPFTMAAMEAGFSVLGRTGGKYDDITVVVAYIL